MQYHSSNLFNDRIKITFIHIALIKQWLELELRTSGFRLDALSVVLRENEEQLSWSFIAELTEIRKLLGDDLKSNVLPIVTYAEVLPQPTAVHALTAANIQFIDYFVRFSSIIIVVIF